MMIYRYFLTFVFVVLFAVVCSAQDKPEELSAKKAAQDFLEAQEKAEKNDASVIDKIDADTMIAVLALFIPNEAEKALNNAEKIVQENELLKQIVEVEKKPLSIVKFDLIKDLFKAKCKENADVQKTAKHVEDEIGKLQKYWDANTTTLDYKIKKLEEKLITDPNDMDTWEQITRARFIREIIRNNTNEDEIKKIVIDPLANMVNVVNVDKNEMTLALHNSCSFLEKYYEGLILEYLGKNKEALIAFLDAPKTVSKKDKIIVESKKFELQMLNNKR
jgi:hypothetical protein